MAKDGRAGRTGDTLPPGAEIADCRIEATFRQEAFANVYRALAGTGGVSVLVRELYPTFVYRAADGSVRCQQASLEDTLQFARGRFVREGRAIGALEAAALPGVLAVHEAYDTAYWVMEPSAGALLGGLIRSGGPAETADIERLAMALTEALDRMHEAGVLHLGIEPSNILVDGDKVRLVGNAFTRFATLRFNPDLARHVPSAYAPLEVHAAAEPADPASDIYGVAAVLYYLATGSEPPAAPARTRGDPVAARLGRASDRIGRGLASAIQEGLELFVEDRPQSVAEWRSTFPCAA